MKTRSIVAGAVVGATVAVFGVTRHVVGDTFGFKGKSEVTKLELAYAPGAKTLRARLRITSAMGDVEYQTSDAETIDRLIHLADMKSRGSRLAVELEGSEVKAFYVVVGGSFFGAE
jgi:hypothetical protein